MGTLEKVNDLRRKGLTEREIISQLQSEGHSPKEIMDSLNQAQIKQAVSAEDSENNPNMTPSLMERPQEESAPSNERYIPQEQTPPSNVPLPEKENYSYPPQNPQKTQEDYSPQPNYSSQPSYPPQEQNYYTPQAREEEYYQYEDSPQEQEYSEEEAYESEMAPEYTQYSQNNTIEIAEQVFSEKIKKIQIQIKEFTEFKTLFESKIEDFSDRLKRIEKVFDKMQITIIDKVSGYGKNLEVLQKEMNMIEDSFSKLINPLLDKSKK